MRTGSGNRRRPQARAPPGLQLAGVRRGRLGATPAAALRPRSERRGAGRAAAAAGAGRRREPALLRVRPFSSRTLRSPRPAAALRGQRPRGQARAVGITAGRRQAGWPRASPHCGSLFRGGGGGGCRRTPTGCPGNLEGPGVRGEEAALPTRPGPPGACGSAGWGRGTLPARDLAGGAPAQRGDGREGGVGQQPKLPGTSCSGSCLLPPQPPRAPGRGREGDSLRCPAPPCGAPRGGRLVQAGVGGGLGGGLE